MKKILYGSLFLLLTACGAEQTDADTAPEHISTWYKTANGLNVTEFQSSTGCWYIVTLVDGGIQPLYDERGQQHCTGPGNK